MVFFAEYQFFEELIGQLNIVDLEYLEIRHAGYCFDDVHVVQSGAQKGEFF